MLPDSTSCLGASTPTPTSTCRSWAKSPRMTSSGEADAGSGTEGMGGAAGGIARRPRRYVMPRYRKRSGMLSLVQSTQSHGTPKLSTPAIYETSCSYI